jgi:hypothetical protein
MLTSSPPVDAAEVRGGGRVARLSRCLRESRVNRSEAYSLLTDELAAYQQLGYDHLSTLVGSCDSRFRRDCDSVEYAIEVAVRWRDDANGDLVVTGCASPSDWGSPHDRLDESVVVRRTCRAGKSASGNESAKPLNIDTFVQGRNC